MCRSTCQGFIRFQQMGHSTSPSSEEFSVSFVVKLRPGQALTYLVLVLALVRILVSVPAPRDLLPRASSPMWSPPLSPCLPLCSSSCACSASQVLARSIRKPSFWGILQQEPAPAFWQTAGSRLATLQRHRRLPATPNSPAAWIPGRGPGIAGIYRSRIGSGECRLSKTCGCRR